MIQEMNRYVPEVILSPLPPHSTLPAVVARCAEPGRRALPLHSCPSRTRRGTTGVFYILVGGEL